jgi:hypothetical protein
VHEQELAYHATLPEQFMRASGLFKRKSPRDERLDLSLSKKVKKDDQVLSKQRRSEPFQPLDAVGNHSLPAREKPAAGNVQTEDGDRSKAMTTSGTT